MNHNSTICDSLIVRGWIRATVKLDEQRENSIANITASPTIPPDISSMNLWSAFISCEPRFKTAMFDLKVSAAGAILGAAQNSSTVYGEVPSHDSSWTILNQTTLSLNGAMYVWPPAWHNDTIATKVLTNSTAFLDVHSPPPDFATTSNITNQICTRTFAVQMSLLAPQLLPAAANIRPVPARRVAPERRVFMSEPLFLSFSNDPNRRFNHGDYILLAHPEAFPASHAGQHCEPDRIFRP